MERECVNVNGVPTKVLTWGKKLKDCNSVHLPNENSNYIICIPGNPGITEFYKEFLEEIYKKTNNNVWVIGHAGHETIASHHIPPPEENKDLYNLQGQVKHKISFIENYVPSHAKITLIGHSIGCYIILKLLQIPSIKSKVVKSYFLFPTIEYMAESKNGIFLVQFLKYLKFLLLPLVSLFNIFPMVIQNFLLTIYCKISRMPSDYKDLVRNFVKPNPIYNCVMMAHDEMLQVRERDNKTLKTNVDKIKLYYGASDGWTPFSYYKNIKTDIPNIDAEICNNGIAHAFVLQNSKLMASILLNWMNTL